MHPASPLLRDPLALTTGLAARLAVSCLAVGLVWAVVMWAW